MGNNQTEKAFEEKRLAQTISLAEEQLKQAKEAADKKKSEIIEAKKDVRENTEHGITSLYTSDGFEALVELSQYINPVTDKIIDYEEEEHKILLLEKMIKSPYFARIDFKFDDEDEFEKIYIGRSSLRKNSYQEMYVYDWRSPIASVFYRFMTGEAFYDAPCGRVTGELNLKRQYEIKNGILEYFFDSDVQIVDEFLRQLLSQNTTAKMKAIVETIQHEQDVVIRDMENDLLMVQGVAGSGKTSIALHRAAYLMYQGLQTKLSANNIMIISPNSIFEQYISNVLPELGEDNVISSVFEDILSEYILAIKFDYGMSLYHNATAHTLVPTQGRPGLPRKLINAYLMKDGTPFTDRAGWEKMPFTEEVKDRDPRLAQTVRTPGYHRIGQTEILAPDLSVSVTGYQPVKFVQDPTASGGQVDRNDRSTCDLPVFRYAEVLLNYAEAKAELGTLTQADLDKTVNVIRDRVAMPHLDMAAANANPDSYLSSAEYGYTNVTGSNQGVILEIRRERAIELTQEGFRFDDLVRWKAGSCVNQSITGMYFPGAGEYDLSGDGVTDVVLYTGDTKPDKKDAQVYKIGSDIVLTEGESGYVDYHHNISRTAFNEERDYLYPIPINERSLNPNLTQNPGWNDGLSF